MVEETTSYSISCDGENCQELYEDCNGNCQFEDEPSEEELNEAGWKVEGDNHFCTECK